MEVPAYSGITVPIVSRWGRKSVVITSFIITAISLFGLAFTPLGKNTARISGVNKLYFKVSLNFFYRLFQFTHISQPLWEVVCFLCLCNHLLARGWALSHDHAHYGPWIGCYNWTIRIHGGSILCWAQGIPFRIYNETRFLSWSVYFQGTTGMDTLPVILFGCVAIVAAGVGFTLPETNSRIMPDSIEDVENETSVVTDISEQVIQTGTPSNW